MTSFLTAIQNFSSLLNFLQGPCCLIGDVIVITTNHIEKLDPAIYRPGRVDVLKLIDYYKKEDLKEWVEFFFREKAFWPEDDSVFDNLIFRPADLSSLFRLHYDSLNDFYKGLIDTSKNLQLMTEEQLIEIEEKKLIEKAAAAEARMTINKAASIIS